MIVQKCFCCLRNRSSKLLPLVHRNKNALRTYIITKAEREKIVKLCTVISTQVNNSFKECSTSPLKKAENTANHQSFELENMHIDGPFSHEELITSLYRCKTVSEQMEILSSTLGLTPEDIQSRKKFSNTLASLYKPFFENVKINVFGSSVNGFGFKGCDLDISFETSVERKEKVTQELVPSNFLISQVINGEISPKEISNLHPKEQLVFAYYIMMEYFKELKNPLVSLNPHAPLVRFTYDKFNLKCDMTFKNKNASVNTKLMLLYCKMDKRVVPLLMTIRYWAKHLGIIGKGRTFKSYTISLLVIYFLQTRKPQVLPSVESILSLSVDNFEHAGIEDQSFLNILQKILHLKISKLQEFFLFYLNFDFTRVICPINSKAIPREEFKKENSKFKMHDICIQDPINLQNNNGGVVEFQCWKTFSEELMIASNILLNNVMLNPSQNPWGLISILDHPKSFVDDLKSLQLISFSVPVLTQTVNGKISGSERISVTSDTLLKLLQHGLMFKCKSLEMEALTNLLEKQDKLIYKSNLKVAKREESVLEQFQTLNATNDLVFSVECEAAHNIFECRDLFHLDSSFDSKSVLDREYLISSNIAKQDKRNESKFLCECYSSRTLPTTMFLIFEPHHKPYFNPILGISLKHHILNIMERRTVIIFANKCFYYMYIVFIDKICTSVIVIISNYETFLN
ncbi:hypothetical protein CEXT_710412 [Caerostris extrusa]|uniref:Poly(A) RNA polymerase, mitochondrial n=1 Tax=Caerostris extrusa TaxID=172846 RepID=A0AAV4WBJ2_CAEEX|nr:hypothetical protein CEXT_710412 [Caerostris extrusa]